MKKAKIALYQSRLKSYIPKSIYKKVKQSKADFFVLPEYFFIDQHVSKVSEQYKDCQRNKSLLKNISMNLPGVIIVGGSFICKQDEKFYNRTYVYLDGVEVGFYNKRKLFQREIGDLSTGDENKVFDVKGFRFSVLICADVFLDENFDNLKALKPEIVFMPTFSPYKEERIEDKIERDQKIYIKRAKELNAFLVKICGVSTFRDRYAIQGRSLIANSEQIIWRVPFHKESEEMLKICNLSLKL